MLDETQMGSKTGYCLLRFVRAVLSYFAVAKEMKPKKEHINSLVSEHNVAISNLCNLNAEIENLETDINAMDKRYNDVVAHKLQLQEDVDVIIEQLTVADRLISGLRIEQKRYGCLCSRICCHWV